MSAVQGNNLACAGQYEAAVEYFTKAIQLDGFDYRYLK
jgi:Flp pilus assembly protein TadD